MTKFIYEFIEDIPGDYALKSDEIFHLYVSPVVIEFDNGMLLGVAQHPEQLSVLTWLERDTKKQLKGAESIYYSSPKCTFSVANSIYAENRFAHVLGDEITGVSFIKRRQSSIGASLRMNEAGIIFKLKSSRELIFNYGLYDRGGDFSVIFREDISSSLVAELTEVPLE